MYGLIPGLLREIERQRGEHEYRITVPRTSHWTEITEHRIASIFNGRILPTDDEWQKIAQFVGRKFRTVSYAKICEAYESDFYKTNSAATPSTSTGAIADDGQYYGEEMLVETPWMIRQRFQDEKEQRRRARSAPSNTR